MVSFCSLPNHVEPCITEELGRYSICEPFNKTQVGSVNPNNNCVMIFESNSCSGKSIVIYPLSEYRFDIKSAGLYTMRSYSRCLNTLECKRFPVSSVNNDVSCSRATNDIDFIGPPTSPKGFYYLDSSKMELWNNHVYYNNDDDVKTYYFALITEKGIDEGSSVTEDVISFVRSNGLSTDYAGLIIPKSIGGPGNETWNAFPMGLNTNVRYWESLESRMRNAIIKSEGGYLMVRFYYDDINNPKRPTRILHRLVDMDFNLLFQNDVTNPHHSVRCDPKRNCSTIW